MPRVTTHTASGRAKPPYRCSGCGEDILAGERYYQWTRRVGPKRGFQRHVKCGPPRPTQLSGRKTAQVEEAVQDYSAPVLDVAGVLDGSAINFEEPPDHLDLDVSEFQDAVSGVVDAAEEVADEYESGADNMPESLQYGSQAEAMRDVAERLREWAGELRDKAEEDLSADLPVYGPDDNDDNWLEAVEGALQDAWDERNQELEDAMSDMPEYEG